MNHLNLTKDRPQHTSQLSRFPYIFKFTPLLFLILSCILVQAQGNALKYRINSVQNVNTSYQVYDTSNISLADFIKIRPATIKDSLIEEVYTNNDMKTTIFHQVNTEREAWAKPVLRTVIDKSTVKMYGAGNALLFNQKHSQNYLQNYNALKTRISQGNDDIIPSFTYYTNALKNKLIDSGYVYTQEAQGYKKFTKGDVELLFNNAKFSNQITIYHNGEIYYVNKKVFRTNTGGQLVLAYKITKEWDKRFNDKCVLKTVITDYPSYSIYYAAGKYADESAQEGLITNGEDLTLFPNPAGDQLSVSYFSDIFPSEKIAYEIFDVNGIKMMAYDGVSNTGEFQIALDELSAGLYLLRVDGDAASLSRTFIKN